MIRQLGISALVLAVFAVVFFCCPPVQAGGFGCGAYVWSTPYPADLSSLYAVGAIPRPPYFALHPPVYYDVPVPRTYGYSPWAYPPYMTTPEVVEPMGEIIENKYVPQKTKGKSAKPKVVSAPLRISNPYVISQEGQGESSLAAK